MSKTNNLTDFLIDLANAIRAKSGTSGLIDPQDFASLIANLPQPLFKSLVDQSITEVTAEDLQGVTRIGSYTFYNCNSLTSIVIPDSVTSIGSDAFQFCSRLKSVTIGNGVTSIGGYAFYDCRELTSVTIGNSVKRIGGSAFYNCSRLTSVTIGNGVTSIETLAFSDCRALTSITIKATTPPTLANVNAFNNTNNCPIYVPAASVEAYKAKTNWTSLASRIFAIP